MAHVNKSLSLLLAPRIDEDRKMPTGAKFAALGEWGVESCCQDWSIQRRDWAPIFLVSFILDLRQYFSIDLWSVFNLFDIVATNKLYT